ncbi:MAG: NADH-quinone oxidoreductase subunit N [Fimbriimonadaceae bacterium]|nr:NADH-quinone oxidoreductase subunit N [Chitinophagales bacterium]
MNAIIFIAIAGIASMFAGVFEWRKLILPLNILTCVAAVLIITLGLNGDYTQYLNGMLLFDKISITFSVVMIVLTALVFVISHYYYREQVDHLSDIYALMLFSLAGAIIMVSFNNLVMLFLGIEILSIPLYILAASNRKNLLSNEAGLKYFIIGAFASSFLLLGITLIYGTTGTFSVDGIAAFIKHGDTSNPLFIIGGLLILSALLFKVSAAPFHSWAPDVYQGSPTVITSFMATVVKTAAFGAFVKFISLFMQSNVELWQNILSVVAILTMIVGNVVALYQTNLKRLLAYSGIANAGYVMIAIATLNPESYKYILFYMAGYGVATILAFAIYFIVKEHKKDDRIEGLKGLSSQNKLLTVSLCAAMISLASIPPMTGFFGKYAIFINAIEDGKIWLVIIAVLNSATGVYYYFRVMSTCFQKSETDIKIITPATYNIVLIAGVIVLLILGVYPTLLLQYL